MKKIFSLRFKSAKDRVLEFKNIFHYEFSNVNFNKIKRTNKAINNSVQ